MAVSPKAKSTRKQLLLVTAEMADVAMLTASLQEGGMEPNIVAVRTPGEIRQQLDSRDWDALLSRPAVPHCSPPTILRLLHDGGQDLPLILIANAGEERPVFRGLKGGPPACLTIDRLTEMPALLDREIQQARHRADHRAALEMLKGSEDRFRALASNLPGMAFQLARTPGDALRFLFVSEGGQKLLGLKPHELLANFDRFIEAIDLPDRKGLKLAIDESAAHLSTLNWEGRTRSRSGARSKWINLRSTPEIQPDGSIHWHGIATDITRSKETETALRRSREQLAELSSYLEAAKEEERERIARDIHDELGSLLVAIKIEAALLAGKLSAEQDSLRGKAHAIESLLDQAMGTASRVARELRPGILKEFGLTAAIECQVEDFSQRTGIPCRTQCNDEGLELDEATSLALFRIVQEALTNIAKHAHASLVVIRLTREESHALLEVRDNGRGISENDMAKPKSFGLRGIRERARSLEGEFHIGPGEQGGTHIELRLPLQTLPPSLPAEDLQGDLF